MTLPKKMMKHFKKILLFLVLTLIAVFLGCAISPGGLSQFGTSAKGSRLETMNKSPNYNGKTFINPIETKNSLKAGDFFQGMTRTLLGDEIRRPGKDLPITQLDKNSFTGVFSGKLRITWMGHSTALIEIDGKRILTDPVWNDRCFPSDYIGPKRFHPVPIELEELPKIDAVIISHDHFDHLEKRSACFLAQKGAQFFVPLGVGAHLEKWGIEVSQIKELDWWDESKIKSGDIRIIATPARHYSGKGPFSANTTLWASWAIIGPEHRVFFSGDTGPYPGFAEIGEKYGPFDLSLIKIGAYDRQWPDVHLNPEQALEVHTLVKAGFFIPVHWGTFNLAMHDWFEPAERLQVAAKTKSIKYGIPQPGQIIDVNHPPPVLTWWEDFNK